MGAVYYRSQVGLLTGWVHHTAYIMIVELAIRRSWTHIFCLCAAMEVSFFFLWGQNPKKTCTKANKVPTFFLGFMTLHSDFRSNTLFAVAFFLTRILFHVILCISYFLHDNRTQTTGGSYLPSLILATIFPVHAMWFYGCLKGFFRRASQRHTPISTIDELGILPVDEKASPSPPETQSKRSGRSRSSSKVVDNRYNARSADTTPPPAPAPAPAVPPTFPTYDSKLENSKLHSILGA